MEKIEGVTRIEIIDWRDGAEVVRKFVLPIQDEAFNVKIDFQDGGRTIKIFMKDED